MRNFKKKFYGQPFTKHMKPAAYACIVEEFQHHFMEVQKALKAIAYLEKEYKGIWCKHQFSELSKVHYVNNNLSESFNSWIKEIKGLHVVDLLDQIRQMLMHKFNLRRTVGDKHDCLILPNIAKRLNVASRNFSNVKVTQGGNYTEVNGNDLVGNPWRHIMDLDAQQCSCREWQLTGIPCVHVVAFIYKLRRHRMEDYVHEYYSLDKFRAAYAGRIPALTNKSKWVNVDLGYKMLPPLMKRSAGRPRKERVPGCLEPKKKRRQCKKFKQFSHQQRPCKNDEPLVVAKKR
jgi:SWIM zinc finger